MTRDAIALHLVSKVFQSRAPTFSWIEMGNISVEEWMTAVLRSVAGIQEPLTSTTHDENLSCMLHLSCLTVVNSNGKKHRLHGPEEHKMHNMIQHKNCPEKMLGPLEFSTASHLAIA